MHAVPLNTTTFTSVLTVSGPLYNNGLVHLHVYKKRKYRFYATCTNFNEASTLASSQPFHFTNLTHSPVNMFGVYGVFIVKINKNSLLVCMSS